MIQPSTRSTRTDTRLPYTTLFRSSGKSGANGTSERRSTIRSSQSTQAVDQRRSNCPTVNATSVQSCWSGRGLIQAAHLIGDGLCRLLLAQLGGLRRRGRNLLLLIALAQSVHLFHQLQIGRAHV